MGRGGGRGGANDTPHNLYPTIFLTKRLWFGLSYFSRLFEFITVFKFLSVSQILDGFITFLTVVSKFYQTFQILTVFSKFLLLFFKFTTIFSRL